MFDARTQPSINIDHKGWHVWSNTQSRIIANGPDAHNRLLEFANSDEAVNWFLITGRRELARLINSAAKRQWRN